MFYTRVKNCAVDGLESQPGSMEKTLLIASILFLFTASVSAQYTSYVDWGEPFNPDTTEMPVHFDSSNNRLDFSATIQYNNNGNEVTLQRKSASATSWSDVDTTPWDQGWDHGQTSADAQLDADEVYFPGKSSEVRVDEGGQTTITIDGTEHTLETVDSRPGNSPPEADIRIDGTLYTLYEGEGRFVDGDYIRLGYIGPNSNDQDTVDYHLIDKGYDVSSGNWEYRIKYEFNNPTKPIYFDVEVNDGYNIPYVKNVTVDSNEIFDFSSGTARPGSSISAVIKQQEGDTFNATLVNRATGTEVKELEFNGSGILQGAYNSILESSLGVFTDVSGFQSGDLAIAKFSIPKESELLNNSASNYQLGLKVEDTSKGTAYVRETADYSVDTSGSNDVPNITAVEGYNSGAWFPITQLDEYGASFSKIRLTVEDTNNDVHSISLNLTEVYDGVDRRVDTNLDYGYTQEGNKYVFDLTDSENTVPTTYINESGSWRVDATVSDDTDSDSVTRTWSVPWGNLTVDVTQPVNPFSVYENSSFNFDVDVGCYGGECVNENETLELWPDPERGGVLH